MSSALFGFTVGIWIILMLALPIICSFLYFCHYLDEITREEKLPPERRYHTNMAAAILSGLELVVPLFILASFLFGWVSVEEAEYGAKIYKFFWITFRG